MKTTPKPNATKNNNGELVGPPPPPPPLDGVAVGVGEVTTCGAEVESGSIRKRIRIGPTGGRKKVGMANAISPEFLAPNRTAKPTSSSIFSAQLVVNEWAEVSKNKKKPPDCNDESLFYIYGGSSGIYVDFEGERSKIVRAKGRT